MFFIIVSIDDIYYSFLISIVGTNFEILGQTDR